ncbi:histone deacetylase family protein [Mangrovicoccus ximenensis]|uniref:histone deacetylase family protein n=1 Tax=Mangrovicoccus ximenensis TaxID=1911570 RepID=UPI000D35C575|nr:histone deacetylase family protein [Mangrovicoccus ximenensis]
MKCFYAPETDAHDPQFRLTHGKLLHNAEQADRAKLLLAALGKLGLATESPAEAPRAALEAVHTPELLDFLEHAWEEWQKLPNCGPEVVPNVFAQKATSTYPKDSIVGRAGWHLGDTSAPIGPHSWTATRRAADCAVAAADAVLAGEKMAYALTRPPGHHSTADTVAGHCLMNVAAIAVERMRTQHAKVATLDIDVHHGNGTQGVFYGRADVQTVSVHADPATYYPFFVGYAHETGEGDGEGFNLNIPLPRTTTDEAWLAAIDRALERIAEFAPGALVVSLGLDAHENDPLAGMKVSWDGFREAGRKIAAAGYPTVLIQEGGYLSEDLTTSLESVMEGLLGR